MTVNPESIMLSRIFKCFARAYIWLPLAEYMVTAFNNCREYMKEIFGITRFIGHMDVGAPENEVMMKSIELFGEKVAPKVR